MNIKNLLLALPLTVFMLAACSEKEISVNEEPDAKGRKEVPANAVPGHIRIKLDRQTAYSKGVDLSSLGSYTMVRTFPDGGRFEKRHHEAGLDLWYDVFFDKDIPLTRASGSIKGMEGIESIEYVQPAEPTAMFTFNDPDFSKQWHYYNPGTSNVAVAGCDINLLPAWEVTTGRNDVIVCVNDGGVTWNHPDLASNMWINEAEFNGKPGVDDDGNGYVDDIYGYNFVIREGSNQPIGTITFNDHGTHVAGTIAAVNNNGVGCCGIAGGDGTTGSGVRLMSTQTSGGNAYIGQSMVYAADMGAVLMNCSWEIGSYSKSISEAIDYFNKYAGLDENGTQVGPMAGGLAIFAAGNDSKDTCYPAQQDNVFSVAAVGADYVRSYYTNYGEWVDISAPGGDANKGFNIYSTVPNGYGMMQGTSMAAPHVTGVAALIVSKYGRVGFTRQMLINILKNSANPKMFDYNKGFEKLLGAGLVDAGRAVSFSIAPPEKVGKLTATAKSNFVTLKWNIPGDDGTKPPFRFNIYYADHSLPDLDVDNLPSDVTKVTVDTKEGISAGEAMAQVVSGLKFSTEYHFRVNAESILGAMSDLSEEITVRTLENSKPVIEALDGTSHTLKSHESASMRFKVTDADGHELKYSVTGSLSGLTHSMSDGIITFEINALNANDDKTYSGTLSVTDSYDVTEMPFTYTVLKNHAPEIIKAIGNIVLNVKNEPVTLNLSDYFNDEDGEVLEYSSTMSGMNSTVTHSVSDGILTITGKFLGDATLNVTAMDARGDNAVQKIGILVRDGSRPVDVYPNPVRDKLNVRPGAETGDINVKIIAASGAVFFDGTLGEASPFAPASVDMSGASAGLYTVVVTCGGEEYRTKVVKL